MTGLSPFGGHFPLNHDYGRKGITNLNCKSCVAIFSIPKIQSKGTSFENELGIIGN